MPLEIKELHISVKVGGSRAGAGGSGDAPVQKSPREEGEDKDRLAAECVEQVMQVLRGRKER